MADEKISGKNVKKSIFPRLLDKTAWTGEYYLKIQKMQKQLIHSGTLRATDSKYGESNDSSENSDLLLWRQKTLLVNYFRKYTLKVPASSHFFEI